MSPPSFARSTVLAAACLAGTAAAQTPPDPGPLLAAQREAMAALKSMNGVWRGSAWTLRPSGEKHSIVQTERIGPFLDGTLKVIEGRGHEADGRPSFNAFGIISYNPATRAYSMRSYAQGLAGDFEFVPTPDGYRWEIPAGPAKIRFTATIKGGTLHEIGERLVPDREPVRFFEMTLKRVGGTDWPAAGAVGPH
jgi:hypothetical protein